MRSGFHHKDAAASPWSLHTRPESEPTPRCATRPVARHSTLRLGLMLPNHYPDILHQFVFEFVFRKQHLMRQQRMCGSRGDPGAVGLTRTRAHVRACGPSRRHAERTARPRPELRPVTAARPQPRRVRGSSWKQRQDHDRRPACPSSPRARLCSIRTDSDSPGGVLGREMPGGKLSVNYYAIKLCT